MKKTRMRLILTLLFALLAINPTFATMKEETYYIQVGAYNSETNAHKRASTLTGAGYDTEIIRVHGFYKVFLGPYTSETRARDMGQSLRQYNDFGFLVLASEMYELVEPAPQVHEEKEVPVEVEVVEVTQEALKAETPEEDKDAFVEVIELEKEEPPLVGAITQEDIKGVNKPATEGLKRFIIVFMSILSIILVITLIVYKD